MIHDPRGAKEILEEQIVTLNAKMETLTKKLEAVTEELSRLQKGHEIHGQAISVLIAKDELKPKVINDLLEYAQQANNHFEDINRVLEAIKIHTKM